MPNNDKKKTITQVLVMVLKSFLMKNLIKNLKDGALSRYLIKSIKKYFIKNLIKNLKKCLIMSKKDTLPK